MADRPVQFVALLKDLFSAPAQKVVQTTEAVAKSADTAAASMEKLAAAVAKSSGAGSAQAKSVGDVAAKATALAASARAAGDEAKKASTGLGALGSVGGVIGKALGAAAIATSVMGKAFSVVTAPIRVVTDALFSLKAALGAVVIAFTASQLIGSILATANALDDLNAASKRTGVAVEDLSRLRVAAKLSNVEFSTLARSLGFLSRSVAAVGTDKNIRQAFDDLGISSQTARNVKNVAELLPLISDGLQRLPDTQRLAALQALFGRSAFEILPLLEGNSAKLRASLRVADEFGLVLTRQQVEAADALTDAIDRVGFAWEKVKASIIGALGPNVTALLDRFTKQVSQLPERVQRVAGLVGDTVAKDPGVAQAAFGRLREIGADSIRLLGSAALGVGKIIATAFIETIKIGFEALRPFLSRLFQDILAPIVNPLIKIAGGTEIPKTTRGQLADVDAQIAAAREEALRRRQGVADRGPIGLLGGQRVTGRADTDLVTPQSFEAQLRAADPLFDQLLAKRAELTTQLDRENKETNDALVESFQSGYKAVGKATSDFVAKTISDYDALTKKIDESTSQTEQDSKKFAEQQDRQRALADGLDEARRRIATFMFNLRRLPAEAAEIVGKLIENIAKIQSAGQDIERAGLRALRPSDDAELARAELANQQQDRRTKLVKEFGAAFATLAPILADTERAEASRLEIDQRAKQALEDLKRAEEDYAQALEVRRNALEAGQTPSEESAAKLAELRDRLLALADASPAAVEALRAQFPEFSAVLDDYVRQANQAGARIKAGVEKPVSGLGDAFARAFRRLPAEMDAVVGTVGQIASTIGDALTNGISKALTDVITGVKSAKDAFLDLGRSAVTTLLQLVIKLLLLKLILLPLFGPLAIFANTGGLVGPQRVRRLAGGGFAGFSGHVPGPRVNADIVPALLTPREYVHDVPTVDYYGAGVMEAMRQKAIPREMLQQYSRSPKVVSAGGFATGGQVAAPGLEPSGPTPAYVVASDQSLATLLAGGRNAFIRFLADNRGQINASLGRR